MAARMIFFALALAWLIPSAAAALPDPTALPAAPSATGDAARLTGTLTAIKTSRRQKIAVIDGLEVAVGGRYQDARVVRIGESEVVLRRGRETTVLKLYPHIDKQLRGK